MDVGGWHADPGHHSGHEAMGPALARYSLRCIGIHCLYGDLRSGIAGCRRDRRAAPRISAAHISCGRAGRSAAAGRGCAGHDAAGRGRYDFDVDRLCGATRLRSGRRSGVGGHWFGQPVGRSLSGFPHQHQRLAYRSGRTVRGQDPVDRRGCRPVCAWPCCSSCRGW